MPKRKQLPASSNSLLDKPCRECGAIFRPSKATSRYCSRICMWKNNGKSNPTKTEGWSKSPRGYVQGFVRVDGKRINYKQHRRVMELYLGRTLLPTEDVHHINGDKSDNRVENLLVIDHGEHTKLHTLGKPSRNPRGRCAL